MVAISEPPGIRGLVLDAETKRPLPDAIDNGNVSDKDEDGCGRVSITLVFRAVNILHTRTDVNRRFIIPAKTFSTPPFPLGFENEVESFGIGIY